MSANNQFDWVEFYKELSEKLLAFKDNRPELIQRVKQIFSDTGINISNFPQGFSLETLIK